jgi:peptidyl-prolyl cis-trans isomerase D
MLRGLRKASANWLGRTVMAVVMGLLAASFAIWGINDIFRGFGRSTLAKVGNTEISIEAFRQTYNQRLQQISRQLGRVLTPEQANALGLDRQVLAEMMAEAALDQRAKQLGLRLPQAEVVRHITNDPMFHNQNGQFDRARFEDLLRSAGYSEQRFIAEQTRIMLRREIMDSISGSLITPKAWLAAANEYRDQERSIQYVRLGAAQAGDIPQPTPEQLAKYFEARKIMFRAPEYRKLATVSLTPAEMAKWMVIPDADVKAYFDEHRSRYITPERRHVEQIVFPTMQEAEAAEVRLKSGTSFTALAAERGLKEQDIDLGTIAKSEIVDPAVADAAFSLKEGEVSAPIKGRFGAVIVTVLKIVPEEAKTFADVAPQIRKDIATERAKAEVQKLHDQIEDARAGGSTLQEAAQKAKVPIVTYNVDRSGRDPSGKQVANLPHSGEVLAAAFASDVGVDNDPIAVDDGYVWYDVTAITPAHDRSLDEVKSEVEARWRQDEVASRLKAKAADMLDKLKSGNAFDALAKADGLTIQTTEGLKRGKGTADISANAINAVFHTAKDAYGSSEGDTPSDWVIFRVTAVVTPKLDVGSAEGKRLDEAVQRQESNDIVAQYVAKLETELGTSVNERVLAEATGSGAPE